MSRTHCLDFDGATIDGLKKLALEVDQFTVVFSDWSAPRGPKGGDWLHAVQRDGSGRRLRGLLLRILDVDYSYTWKVTLRAPTEDEFGEIVNPVIATAKAIAEGGPSHPRDGDSREQGGES